MTNFDVAIIGGGVTGSSIAYHLARQGARVGVFEQAEPAAEPSASWASAGGVRSQGRDPREWSLTLEATRRWPTLEDELDADVGFARGGHLHIVEDPADLPALTARVAREQAAGIQIRMIDGPELLDVAPPITPTAIAGAYTVGDGQANPPKTTRAFAAAAQRHGARYRTGTAARGLAVAGDRVIGLMAGDETITAEWVVLATGAWSERLALGIGLDLPLRTRAPQMLLTDAAPSMLQPTVTGVGRQLSLKQLPTGEFLIGGGWPSDVLVDEGAMTGRVREESVAGSWVVASAVVPAVRKQRIAQRWCGLEAQCFDGVPLLGRAPGLDGLYLAAGFSGHGFQISPAVGRAVADALMGHSVEALEGLSPARTLSFAPTAIAEFKSEPTGAMAAGLLG